MGKPQTLTDLANRVLLDLGMDRISSIDSTTDRHAVKMSGLIYDVIRDVQSSYKWPELQTVTTLSRDPEDHADGSYRWNLPTNYLNDTGIISAVGAIYRFEDNHLVYTTATDPQLHYVRYSENVAEWSHELWSVTWRTLAAEAAQILAQDVGLAEQKMRNAEKAARKYAGRASRKRDTGRRINNDTSWNLARQGYDFDGYSSRTTNRG